MPRCWIEQQTFCLQDKRSTTELQRHLFPCHDWIRLQLDVKIVVCLVDVGAQQLPRFKVVQQFIGIVTDQQWCMYSQVILDMGSLYIPIHLNLLINNLSFGYKYQCIIEVQLERRIEVVPHFLALSLCRWRPTEMTSVIRGIFFFDYLVQF